MADFKAVLIKLNQNLNTLRERKAKYGGNAPPELLNQIEDHEQAIALTEQVIIGELSEADWQEALKPLLVAISERTSEETSVTIGDVYGGIHDSVIAGRDANVTIGQKIINIVLGDPDQHSALRHRRDMLKLVRDSWIKGVLEKSLDGTAPIELEMEVRNDTVERPRAIKLRTPDKPNRTLPPGTKIVDVFDEMGKALLILGDAGSGKTTVLLELARDAIARAEQDPGQPIPVVFKLSSWTNREQPIAEWLVEELKKSYNIPKKIANPWINRDELLLLFDGLDEVTSECRGACVVAINHFGQEIGSAGLVVCSRLREYLDLSVSLKLNGAISLLALTPEQVDHYLAQAGLKLNPLRASLQEDEPLRELAQSPLMLSIMRQTYQNRIVPLGQPLETAKDRRRHLFDAYIKEMFKWKEERDKPYTDEQMMKWLVWLARGMREHHQTIFLIEQLQPSWLSTRFRRLIYVFASRLVVGLITGPIGGLIFGLSFQLSFGSEGLKRGLVQGLMGGLLLGLIVGLIDAIWIERHGKRVTTVSQASKLWKAVVNIIFVGLSVWLSFALISWLILGSIHWLNQGPDFWGPEGLVVGLLFGVSAGAIFGPRANRQSPMNDIETVESLSWSKRQAISWGAFGLMIGLPIGLLFGLIEKRFPGVTAFSLPLHSASMNILLMFMLINSLIGGAVGTIVGGLRGRALETKIAPNQGIRLSVMNAAFVGLVGGLGFGLTLGTIGILISILGLSDLHGIIVNGLSYGLHGIFVGLLMALWYGGLNVIQHYTLRLILWYRDHTPCNYARFLDYAAELTFLRKVGGGYIFIHSLLKEYFASLKSEQ